MAQSTEDYLDSLLRQAMGIPDPEPEKKPEETVDLAREDVLAMADGLTGSNSAILGNAYDHNASFTNEGEIEHVAETPVIESVASAEPAPAPQIPVETAAADTFATESFTAEAPAAEIPAVEIPAVETPVVDTPVADTFPTEAFTETENLIPEEMQAIPDGPVVEHDGNLDIIPEPSMMKEIPLPDVGLVEEPAATEPAVEESAPVAIEPVVQEPVIEEPMIDTPLDEIPMDEIPMEDISMAQMPVEEIPLAEETVPEVPVVAEDIPVMEAVEPVMTEPVAEEPMPEEPAAQIPSGNEQLDQSDIEALLASMQDEPVAEEPVAEEPVIEEPAVEEPVAEEAVAEPVAEEPVAEVQDTPAISIDDLDPNDSTKALDPDMIAALFAGANESAEEAPAEETPAEEMPAEETPLEEAPAEEIAAEEETPIEEASVEEEVAAEESVAEEPAAEGEADIIDPFADSDMDSLEALDISLGEPEEAPLMPDQEISDLLSTLGELSGETPDEAEEAAEEESAEAGSEEAPVAEESASEEGETPDLGIDGIDMFDTDLSAMLDDVTNNLDSAGETPSASEDSDLNDLLGSLDDGSGDLSDIGSLLDKDENSELVDPNTETAEALFASGSEDEIFNIDNLIDEEENPKGKKKKKKKGFSLFGKKKKGESDIEVIGGDEEMLIDPELLDIPEKDFTEKQPGFFARLFAKLFEEVGEDNDDVSGIEQSAVDIAAEGAAENEAILSELEGEEAGGGKKEKKKKEKKKKDKKDKKDAKGGEGDGEEGEEGAEDTKKKKKEKKKKEKKEKLPEIPGKKLPRKKVVAISLFCITIGLVITFLAFLIPYSQDIKKAKKFYTTGEYQKTYEYMRGHKLTSEDQMLYDRTVTLLRIKRPYDSYQNYMKMGLRMEALNALVQGVQMTDRYAEDAATLGIIDKYSKQSRLIYDELYNSFGVSVDMARSWIELEGTPEYTRALYGALVGSSPSNAAADGSEEPAQTDEFSFDVDPDADPVINAEENDL